MKKESSEVFIIIILWLVIAALFCAIFARYDEENETNTYTYKTTISNVKWKHTKSSNVIIFDTNKGTAYYKIINLSYVPEIEAVVSKLENVSMKGVPVKLIATEEKDLFDVSWSYIKTVAISTDDEVFFPIDVHNEYDYHRKVFFIIVLSICTLFMGLYTWTWAYYERPFRKLRRKVKKHIRKYKNNHM